MSHLFKKTTLLFIFLFCILSSFGQQKTLSKDAFISILTCDSGSELYSLFGHTAIRISDPANFVDVVYNYGAFDFATPNFYLKFTKGDLQYFVTTSTYDEFLSEYRYYQRGVYEQKLNLNSNQKQHIFDELSAVLNSDKRFYTYKFIDRNCTTMVVDVLQNNLNTKLSLKVKDADKTYRTILYGYLKPHFYENLGISILFGAKTDQMFGKIFLPLQFMESIAHSKNGAVPLTNATDIVNIDSAPEAPASLWNNIYTYILFLITIVIINKRGLTISFLSFIGFFGLFLVSASFYSLHHELEMNYNILLFNPILLVLVFFILKNKTDLALKTAYIMAVAILIYCGVMLNKAHLLILLPMILTIAIILGRLIVGFRKQ